MSFITSILDSVTHFGHAVEKLEAELKNVTPGSEDELKLLLECSFCYGHVQLQKGEALANDAIVLAEKRNDNRKLAQAFCCKAYNQFRIGYSVEARTTGAKALELSQSKDDLAGIADAHWILGTMMEVLATDEDVDHHQSALEAYQQLGDLTGIYLAQIQLNSIPLRDFQLEEVLKSQENLKAKLSPTKQRHLYSYCHSETLRALFMRQEIPLLKKGLEEWKNLGEANGNFHDYTQAKCLLVECYRLQHLDEVVMKECLESMDCCEKLGTLHGESTMLIILANICSQQSQYTDAVKYFELADSIALKIGAHYKHLYILNATGSALLKSGDFSAAQQKFETALSGAMEINDQLNLIEAHRNLAELSLEQNDFNRALHEFKSLFELAGKEGLRIQDYGRYAEALGKASDEVLSDAGIEPAKRNAMQLQNLQQHLEVAQHQQSKREEANAYSALADYYEERENLKEALRYRKDYSNSYEVMVNEQNNSAIAKLRTQYEAGIKDREIALLKKEKEQSLLTERLRISRDLHDDMGTTLGSIGMYSDIAIDKLKKQHPDQIPELLHKIGIASRLTIDRMSDLVWSLDSAYDGFENIFDRMKAFAGIMFNPREINFVFETKGDFTKVLLTMQQRKNIFLIFKEAIYNITKYAECSMVNIVLTHHHNNLQLIIEDNGKGFNPAEVVSYNGNGLKNMKARTKEINGEFAITSEVGKGSDITIKVML